jgi:hypothetical protein
MAPLFEHYGGQLWMPEAGGRVNFQAEGDEQMMLALGAQSKREITRTRIRVRTALAAQARDQGRYLSGRPPYGYRLADAGPHPNKAHAAWGRRARRLEPEIHKVRMPWRNSLIAVSTLSPAPWERREKVARSCSKPVPSMSCHDRGPRDPRRAGRVLRSRCRRLSCTGVKLHADAAGWAEFVQLKRGWGPGDARAAGGDPGGDLADRVLVVDEPEPDRARPGDAARRARADDDDVGALTHVQAVRLTQLRA